jgi:hypothetical protein
MGYIRFNPRLLRRIHLLVNQCRRRHIVAFLRSRRIMLIDDPTWAIDEFAVLVLIIRGITSPAASRRYLRIISVNSELNGGKYLPLLPLFRDLPKPMSTSLQWHADLNVSTRAKRWGWPSELMKLYDSVMSM